MSTVTFSSQPIGDEKKLYVGNCSYNVSDGQPSTSFSWRGYNTSKQNGPIVRQGVGNSSAFGAIIGKPLMGFIMLDKSFSLKGKIIRKVTISYTNASVGTSKEKWYGFYKSKKQNIDETTDGYPHQNSNDETYTTKHNHSDFWAENNIICDNSLTEADRYKILQATNGQSYTVDITNKTKDYIAAGNICFLIWEYNIDLNATDYSNGYSHMMNTTSNPIEITIEYEDGCVQLYDGTEWRNAIPWIYTSDGWKQCVPYIYNGTDWKQCTSI